MNFKVGSKLMVAAGVAIAIVFVARAFLSFQEEESRKGAVKDLKRIGIALITYQDRHGRLPRLANVLDDNGHPRPSWRVLILPDIGYPELYDEYDFTEAWDGPNNIRLLRKIPPTYRCPGDGSPASSTNYVAISELNGEDGAKWHTVNDWPVVVQISNIDIPWTKPEDLTVVEALRPVNSKGTRCISSPFADGAFMFGVSIDNFISQDLSAAEHRRILRIDFPENR